MTSAVLENPSGSQVTNSCRQWEGTGERVAAHCTPSAAFRIRPRSATFPRMRVSVAGINVGAALLVLCLQVAEIVTSVTRTNLSPSVAR